MDANRGITAKDLLVNKEILQAQVLGEEKWNLVARSTKGPSYTLSKLFRGQSHFRSTINEYLIRSIKANPSNWTLRSNYQSFCRKLKVAEVSLPEDPIVVEIASRNLFMLLRNKKTILDGLSIASNRKGYYWISLELSKHNGRLLGIIVRSTSTVVFEAGEQKKSYLLRLRVRFSSKDQRAIPTESPLNSANMSQAVYNRMVKLLDAEATRLGKDMLAQDVSWWGCGGEELIQRISPTFHLSEFAKKILVGEKVPMKLFAIDKTNKPHIHDLLSKLPVEILKKVVFNLSDANAKNLALCSKRLYNTAMPIAQAKIAWPLLEGFSEQEKFTTFLHDPDTVARGGQSRH